MIIYILNIINVLNPINLQIIRKIPLDNFSTTDSEFNSPLDIYITTQGKGSKHKNLYIIDAARNRDDDQLLVIFNMEGQLNPIKIYENTIEKPNLNINIGPSYKIIDRTIDIL